MGDKQILLYRKGTKLQMADLNALREAGFVPIEVARFDDVRVLDPFVAGERSAVWCAAIEAIAKANAQEGVKTLFGRLLAEKLSDCSLPEKPQEPAAG